MTKRLFAASVSLFAFLSLDHVSFAQVAPQLGPTPLGLCTSGPSTSPTGGTLYNQACVKNGATFSLLVMNNDARLKAVAPTALSYDAYGDSITAGYAASVPANNWVSLFGTFLNLTPNNHGVSGSEMADQQPVIYQQTVSETAYQLFTLMIGTNEGAFYGSAVNRQMTYQALHQASAAWLATPTRFKTVGQAIAPVVAISSITSNNTVGVQDLVTVTTSAPHGFATGQAITVAGATQTAYNVTAPITVTGTNTFTYYVNNPTSGSVVSPATTSTSLIATGPGISYTGTWAADSTDFGGAMSENSTTQNSTATFSCYGVTCYLAYGMATNDNGTFSVAVDGTTYGTYTSNGVSGGFATTNIGATHGSGLARLSGLTNQPHTVVVTVTSPTGTGNDVWIDWVGSPAGAPNGSQPFGGPQLLVGGAPRQGNGNYASSLFAALAQQDVGLLASDGLNVTFVDTAAVMNAGTDIIADNTHPNDLGEQHIVGAYIAALGSAANGKAKSTFLASQNAGVLSGGAAFGNGVRNAAPGNVVLAGGFGGSNVISNVDYDNTIAGGTLNAISGVRGGGNSYNFLGGGTQNNIQFGSNNFLGAGALNVDTGSALVNCGGQSNNVSGSFGSVCGGYLATTRGRYGLLAFANGGFGAVQGTAQGGRQLLRATSSAATSTRLTADQAAASSANCYNIPSSSTFNLSMSLVGHDKTTTATWYAWTVPIAVLHRDVAATTTTLSTGMPSILASSSSINAGTIVAVSADTTNTCVNVSVTPPNADTWDWVATVQALEAQ